MRRGAACKRCCAVAGALAVEYAGVIGLAWDLCYWSIAQALLLWVTLWQSCQVLLLWVTLWQVLSLWSTRELLASPGISVTGPSPCPSHPPFHFPNLATESFIAPKISLAGLSLSRNESEWPARHPPARRLPSFAFTILIL
jgi:hypothetical protein